MKIKLDITTEEANKMLTLFGEALHLVSRSIAMGMAPSVAPTKPWSADKPVDADADVDADCDDPTTHEDCDGPSEQGIDPDDLPFVPGPMPDIEFGVPRNPSAPTVSPLALPRGESLCLHYGLTHEGGMPRTLEVVSADDFGVTLGMRGRSELPAIYADVPQVTLKWPENDQHAVLKGTLVLGRLFDAWFSHTYTKVPHACDGLLDQMANDGSDLRAKQAIVFGANACLNRAAWRWLLDLQGSGALAQRFPEWARLNLFDLADKLAGDIAAGVQGFWPEWTLFLDITPNWRKLHTTQEQA